MLLGFGMVFLIGSLVFYVSFPLFLGQLVDFTLNAEKGVYDDTQFRDEWLGILWKVLVVAAVSVVCELLSYLLLKVCVSKMEQELRYDIYHCYFRKCYELNSESEGQLDNKKCLQQFNFKEISDNIDVLGKHLEEKLPQKAKYFICLLASLVLMFVTSWELTLLFFGGLILYGITSFFSSRVYERAVEGGYKIKNDMHLLTQTSLESQLRLDLDNYSNLSSDFKAKNRLLHSRTKRDTISISTCRAV